MRFGAVKPSRKLSRNLRLETLPRRLGYGTLPPYLTMVERMLIGYARVSTQDQSLDLQLDALDKAGCERVFSDRASGAKAARPGLDEALSFARPGDTLVVWKLDRLGRSLRHLIDTIQALSERGIGFRSLQESIDTTTPGGKLVFHVFGALAEFERDLIRERTNAGLKSARTRGKMGGRPKALSDKQRQQAKALLKDPSISISEICKTLQVGRSTLYRYASAKDAT
jgi:DNA invertase Pin-like site-specific DNA recombinase